MRPQSQVVAVMDCGPSILYNVDIVNRLHLARWRSLRYGYSYDTYM